MGDGIMKVLYYEPYASTRRVQLVKKCIGYIRHGFTVLYILPSREAMFDVRRLFMEHMGGIFNCHVMGFDDLERMIVAESIPQKPVMDGTEKRVMLNGIMNGLSPDNFFGAARHKPGFISQVINAIRLLKRSYITPERFFSKTADFQGSLLEKCMGLYEIYSKYESIKAARGAMDVDDISFEAVSKCSQAGIFKGVKAMVIDGFVNIDPVNMMLIRRIIEHFPHIEIYVNVPYRNAHNEEFLVKGIIADFARLGFEVVGADGLASQSELRAACTPDYTGPLSHSGSLPFTGLPACEGINPELLNLAYHLFSTGSRIKVSGDSLRILNSPCIDHELRVAAGFIKEMVQELQVSPDEIAVVVADMEAYRDKALEVFEECGIPISVRYAGKLGRISLIKEIMVPLKYALYREERDDCFISMVTSVYLIPEGVLSFEGFSNARLMRMAHDALKANPDEPFSAFLALYLDSTEDEYAGVCMRNYIDGVIALVDELEKWVQQPELGIDEVVRCFDILKGFLRVLNLAGRISLLREKGIIPLDMWLSDMKALAAATEVLGRLEELYGRYAQLKGVRYSGRDIVNYIFESLSSVDAGDVGGKMGGVKLITPDLMRGQRYYAVFMLGLNEGIFPAANNAVRLFDGYEANRLFELGINLMPAAWELEREKIRFNACIAAAGQRLFLSYRTLDEGGSVMNPSPFIDEVLSVLEDSSREPVVEGRVTMRDRMAFNGQPLSLGEAVKSIATVLRNEGADASDGLGAKICAPEIIDHLKYPAYASCVEFSREFAPEFDAYDGKLNASPELQRDRPYSISVSKINEYARCPFKYFAKAVLGVEEDADSRASMAISSFYHKVLKRYYQGDCDPLAPDAGRFDSIFEDELKNVSLDHVPSPLRGYAVDEMRDTLLNFINHDARAMRRYREVTGCTLKPALLEYPFKLPLKAESATVIISGIVDRVDVELDGQGNFTGRFIIYDYKKKGISDLKDCIEGRDFQLPLYHMGIRDVIREMCGTDEVRCLALLYYSIEELNRRGILSADIKGALFEGKKGPRDLPTSANMEVILSWSLKRALGMVEEIRKGHFMPPPACPYEFPGCAYRAMCRHNRVRLARKAGMIDD